MIRRSNRTRPEDLDTQILEWFDPLLEDRPNAKVPLIPHAADLARAVVEIEIRRELVPLGLRPHGCRIAVVFLHVRARAHQTFLFPAPQRDANRTTRLHTRRL